MNPGQTPAHYSSSMPARVDEKLWNRIVEFEKLGEAIVSARGGRAAKFKLHPEQIATLAASSTLIAASEMLGVTTPQSFPKHNLPDETVRHLARDWEEHGHHLTFDGVPPGCKVTNVELKSLGIATAPQHYVREQAAA